MSEILIITTIILLIVLCYFIKTNVDNEHFDPMDQHKINFIIDNTKISEYIDSMTLPIQIYKPQQSPKSIDLGIPKDIYMVWNSKTLPPIMKTYIEKEIRENPEFKFHIYDLETCREFLKEYFSDEVVEAYDSLTPTAYKVDLWRYCVLYKKGGIYVDIKMFPVDGFKYIDILDKERFALERSGNFWKHNTFGVANSLIISKASNIVLRDCIKSIVSNCKNKYYGFNTLYPTGPGLLGLVYFNYKQKWDDMDLFFTGFYKGKYTIQLGKNIILQSYPEYNNERATYGTSHYAKLYYEKNIYGENKKHRVKKV